MIIFKMNPLICCWGPGEGPGGSLGGASSDGSMGGNFGGGISGGGNVGFGSDEGNEGFDPNDGSDTAAAAMVAAVGSNNPADIAAALGITASEAIAMADVVSGQQAMTTEATAATAKAIKKANSKTLMSFLGSLLTGMAPIGLIGRAFKSSQTVENVQTQIAAVYGDDIAEAAMSSVMAGFANTDTTSTPSELESKSLKFIQTIAGNSQMANLIISQNPDYSNDDVLTALNDRKARDTAIEKAYMDSSSATSDGFGRSSEAYNETLNSRLNLVSTGRGRSDRGQEIGLPSWYQKYYQSGTLGADDPYTNSATDLPTSDEDDTIDNGGIPDNATPRDRILHAYKNLGREGIGDRPNQIDQEGLDYWTEQFANGSVNAETFQGVFDFAAASSDTQRSAISDIPDTIPENLRPGINDYVNRSNDITDIYNQKAESLWDDYLGFEKTYFDEYQGIKDQYKSNLASIPSMNLQLPDTMGGATMPMAPKVHSKMYGDQANTMGHLTESQSQTNLQGIRGRDTLAQNQYTVNQTGLTNSLLPTQTALDLYKMERGGELGLQRIEAGQPDDPSNWSVWAPVAGEFLSSNWGDSTIAENLWDLAKKGLFG